MRHEEGSDLPKDTQQVSGKVEFLLLTLAYPEDKIINNWRS